MSGESIGSGLSFRLGRFPVHMPWSSLLGILIISWFWLPSFRSYDTGTNPLVLAGLFAVLFYVTILGHELGHALVAQAVGFPVSGITLWWLGGYTTFHRARESALRDGVIAAAGPLSSLTMGLGFALLATTFYPAPGTRVSDGYALAFALAWSNVFLAVYNALPGLPLDGGNVLRAVVWGLTGDEARATLVAGWAGRATAVAVATLPLWGAPWFGGPPSPTQMIFSVMIGVFLWQGASQAIRSSTVSARVPGLSARALARPAVVVAPDTPLAEALRRRDEAGAAGFVLVDAEGRPTGVGSPAAVAAVPAERRPWVPVSSVSVAFDPRAVVSADLVGHDLVGVLASVPAEHYLVVDPAGGPVALLATADVEAALSAG